MRWRREKPGFISRYSWVAHINGWEIRADCYGDVGLDWGRRKKGCWTWFVSEPFGGRRTWVSGWAETASAAKRKALRAALRLAR